MMMVLPRRRGRYGPELVTNGTFDANITGWTAAQSGQITAEWAAGRIEVTNLDVAGKGFVAPLALEIGKTYLVTGVGNRKSGAGHVRLSIINAAFTTIRVNSPDIMSSTDVSVSYEFTAVATDDHVYLRVSTLNAVGSYDNISVKEVL